jgi:hypothetical protein
MAAAIKEKEKGPLRTESTNAGGLCGSISLPVPVQ